MPDDADQAENGAADAPSAQGPAVVDADGLVLGRLCTHVAKRLLDGEQISVVRAERAVISGDRNEIVQRYRDKRNLGTQRKGPFFPRTPDRILKRAIRGMVPYQKPRGREALARLRVFMGVPTELAGADAATVPDATSEALVSFITLAELAEALGYEATYEAGSQAGTEAEAEVNP